MTENVRGRFQALRSIWPTVSDTDKVGVITRLESLLRRSRKAPASEHDATLDGEIQDLIKAIQTSLGQGRRDW